MYQHLDSLVVRAATGRPVSLEGGRWPGLVGQAANPDSWHRWLRRTMRNAEFAAALDLASPVLARRVREICEGRQMSESAARRVVLATMRYHLRAAGRATPFGLFAGVAPARVADLSSVRMGAAHRAVARVEAGWLTAVIERLEADPAIRPQLSVTTNNLVFERDGFLVLEHRPSGSAADPPAHVQVRTTRPIRAAMGMAAHPIRLGGLAARLAAEFAPVPASVVDALLADLVAQRLLITNLRPAMTVSDPLAHLVGVLAPMVAAGHAAEAEVVTTVARLREIADGLRMHDSAPRGDIAGRLRARLAGAMADVCPTSEPALAVDLRMDWELAVPRSVAAEAATAAGVLVRLAPRPTLSPGWDNWHGRFLERYGPHALVPVLDAVSADIGLGYPAGYLGAPAPAGLALTERDVKLLTLAQKATLHREREILLDETMIEDLVVIGSDARVQPTTELTVRIHAASTRAMREGDFTLAIVGVSRTAGATTGRFLDLFNGEARTRMTAQYASLPPANGGALAVQISAPTRYPHSDNVARVPQVMAHLLPLGEYHDGGIEGGGRITLDDLAVTADAHRIYLLSLSRRQIVEPVVLHAVEPVRYAHPLVRFLAEVTSAMSVPCAPFDWGAAARLPFLPALRYGRTILFPARWLLTAADLPGPAASWEEWDRALAGWREQVMLPPAIYLGEGDQRIGLDLSEPAHGALLRAQLDRAGTAVLRAAPETDAAGWLDGHTHEIVIPLIAAAAPMTTAPWPEKAQVVDRDHGYLPGCDSRFSIKIYARHDGQTRVLTRHLPQLADELETVTAQPRWWFLRYHDPEEHLRLRLAVPADAAAPTAAQISTWTQQLRRTGLISHVQWDTYFPETARFGGTAAMDVAEAYFAADSAAALAQLTAAEKGGPDLRALTAASMLDITIGLIDDATAGMAWLIEHTRTAPAAPARALYQQTLALANPTDQRDLIAQSGGRAVVSSWARRRDALATYRRVLHDTGTPAPTVLLPDLLHLHHARMAGPSQTGERACLHLARAAALSWTARAKKES